MKLQLLTGALLLITACESGYSSGVEGSKPVSTLSASEAATACESLQRYLNDSLPQADRDAFNCAVQALAMEISPEACQAAFNACMVDPPEGPLREIAIDCTGATADETCHATVSETEACVTASVNAARDRIGEVDCSIAGNLSELTRLAEPLPAPEECTRLRETCPSFAEGAL